ncbi:hypothetical protein ILYODFUR_028109 [Ilyodon furcidens]|uniref:Uncharacterized protein n=1 Tax=Ilyodon furcidens TaxID=33524 RepID=A0ABV0VHU9_9TELE
MISLRKLRLNLSTPGGSSYSNLVSHFSDLSNQLLFIIRLFTSLFFFLPVQLVFPVLVPDFFADSKTRKTFTSECSLYVGQTVLKMTEQSGQQDPAETLRRTLSEHANQIHSHDSSLHLLTEQQRQTNQQLVQITSMLQQTLSTQSTTQTWT